MTILELLETHQIGYIYSDSSGLRKQGCAGCNFFIEGQKNEIGSLHEAHRAHLAEVLGKHMQERIDEAVVQELESR